MKVLVVAATTGYQVRSFAAAARELGVECTLATDRCHVLEDPWADRAIAVKFDAPVEVGESGSREFRWVRSSGRSTRRLRRPILLSGLVYVSITSGAVEIANDKHATRRAISVGWLADAVVSSGECRGWATEVEYPCVLKSLHLSASRGVIRANNDAEYRAARDRIAALTPDRHLQVETFIPGDEFALEGLVRDGQLQVLAVFEKPYPLDGPFFEETIYVTADLSTCSTLRRTAQRAVTALGLSDGPIHAEMRVNNAGVWMLEVAARPIGGLCSRVLRFEPGGISLEKRCCGTLWATTPPASHANRVSRRDDDSRAARGHSRKHQRRRTSARGGGDR